MKKKYLAWIFCCLFLLTNCTAQPRDYKTSDVSSLSLMGNTFKETGDDTFTFVVFAHAYGNADVNDDIPSINLTDHLDDVFAMQPSFMVSLGDMVQNGQALQFEILKQSLLEKIDIPVFNAVGNHDIKNRELYSELFGSTYYSFTYGNAVFFILDTELDQCNISGDQLAILQDGIANALVDPQIDQIYILMHKVLFLKSEAIEQNPDYMARPNDFEIFNGNNFSKVMDSLLIPAAKKKPLYLFAGDVGAFGGNMSPFYNKDKRANLSMYAAGIGDTEQDVVFLVSNTGKTVSVQPYRLADGKILDLKNYDLRYWETYGQTPDLRVQQVKELISTCTAEVCRFAKNTFHVQCRYFIVVAAGLLFGIFIAPWVDRYRKNKTSKK